MDLEEPLLREATVKIGLERIDIQERITVEALLDSRVIGLVISMKLVRKQGFKLKKIKRLIYVKNVDGTFNKKRLIANTIEVNIFYKRYRKKQR